VYENWELASKMLGKLACCTVALVLTLSGCATQIQKPKPVCPGKASAAEALSALRLQCQKVSPLRASGTCLLTYYTEGKQRRENFPVRVWLNPPNEIYMQGDVAFDPRGIVVGSNEEEFWLAIRLKEVSSYWWGRWEEASYLDELVISPRVVLEALGVAAIGSEKEGAENWSLSQEGAFDVLTESTDEGRIVKRIYVFCCDYLIHRIEYLGPDGEVIVAAELDKYRQVVEGFSVPSTIQIVRPDGNAEDLTSITVTLRSVKPVRFTEQQRSRLFTRPPAQGFEHVLINVGGTWVEQQ